MTTTVIDRAALVAGVDLETIDFALLVGMLARLQSWHQNEAGLLEKGKRSLCSDIRQQGVELLEQFAQQRAEGVENAGRQLASLHKKQKRD